MTRKDPRRRSGIVRVALAALAALAFWPSLRGGTIPRALAASGPFHDMVQPSTSDLEAAFDLVGRGLAPAGYPQPAQGWLVPVSLLKAIAWTESHWKQFDAPGHALVSTDGGYGLMQITSGMEPGGLPAQTRAAIAGNFLFNIAYGAQVLLDKLMLTPNIGDDDPAILEHWYYALWAYNGWGWVNNPNNPAFTRSGTPATDPATWPYQERVFYWLAHPPSGAPSSPLWPAIPVSLPDAGAIGTNPSPLPEVAAPHGDVAMPVPPLNLGASDDAAFVGDLSVPDGQIVAPGRRFRKVWQLRNRGANSWGPGYRWAPVSGPAMGDSAGVPVPPTVPLVDVAVAADLTAPSSPGEYREYWQMIAPGGRRFGVKAWVDVRVAGRAPSAAAATPTLSGLSEAASVGGGTTPSRADLSQPAASTPAAIAASSPGPGTEIGDAAVYGGDVNVPDGTVFRPGEHFVKSWKIRNIGTTTWTGGYRWRFEAGTLMSAVQSVPAPPTSPGGLAIISVAMIAPTATGVYTSFWQMSNAAGRAFPHQAWVNIIVRGQPAPTAPSPLPTQQPTAVPTATTRPAATAITIPAQPTIAIPGSGGQLVASPWVGALAFRTFFAAGTTAGGSRETIGVYYPGPGAAHVRVTLFRPDAAQRMLTFTLSAGSRRVLALNRIAPGTGLAVMVEADRFVVAERMAAGVLGLLADPGAARTARAWLFQALPAGAPPDQRLVLFNPHEETAVATLRVGLPNGGCCAAVTQIRVPPLRQFVYDMGSAPSLRGPMTLLADSVVAVERLAQTADGGSVMGVPGTVVGASSWYLPYVHADKYGGAVTVFNPGQKPIKATVRLALDEGAGGWQQRTVPPFTQISVPVSSMTTGVAAAAIVEATGPVVAGAVRYWGAGQPAASMGSAIGSTFWTLFTGLAGRAFSEAVDIVNPSAALCTVTVAEFGAQGQPSNRWSIAMPGHSRYSRLLGGIGAGGSTLLISATQPVSVGRTSTGDAGSASSVALPLQAL